MLSRKIMGYMANAIRCLIALVELLLMTAALSSTGLLLQPDMPDIFRMYTHFKRKQSLVSKILSMKCNRMLVTCWCHVIIAALQSDQHVRRIMLHRVACPNAAWCAAVTTCCTSRHPDDDFQTDHENVRSNQYVHIHCRPHWPSPRRMLL